ncbi:hypothetical protein [Corticimicrobacter populi]|uniref:Uncharacterized protein n=1 Tax=Corticimicrobacter populi TaxID=2175229 RepID=A0A2V1JYB0_9BURK|nr:hypothetical protein [Corticimicrobacter populi]PWF22092.1 hypothetical protein DD235_11950 [Corticimicrobacter populi]
MNDLKSLNGVDADKPGFKNLLFFMVICALLLSSTIALVYGGVWLYYHFVLQIPSGMDFRILLMRALRIGTSTGCLAGLGVWIHIRMQYGRGDRS